MILLRNGNFDPNKTDDDGNTPLHWSVWASSTNQDTRHVAFRFEDITGIKDKDNEK